jgi:hypothetical protein
MTERADQLQHDNAPVNSTALVQTFVFGKASHNPGVKYVNFWVIPRRLGYIGRRFETLCQAQLQRLVV